LTSWMLGDSIRLFLSSPALQLNCLLLVTITVLTLVVSEFIFRRFFQSRSRPEMASSASTASSSSSSSVTSASEKTLSIGSRDMTASELAAFNGSTSELPILVAVNGFIYDVSSRPELYGKQGGYSLFAGRDVSRALALMDLKCTETHLDDLDEESKQTLADWVAKYQKQYTIVGRLLPAAKATSVDKLQLPAAAATSTAASSTGNVNHGAATSVSAAPVSVNKL